MRIVFFETEEREINFFGKNLADHELVFHKEKLTIENAEVAADAEIVSIFVGSRLDQAVIAKLPRLIGITTRSTGTDHIDLEFCKQKNITVLSVPTYGVNTVAEHTFALILTLSRKIHQSILQTQKGDFSNRHLRGFDLAGKTLGLIGLGHIGGRVAQLAQAFKMKVLVFTRTPKPMAGVEFVDLETLLTHADIITLHTPLTTQTRHILNNDNLPLVKKGALLINTARGGLIQTEALVKTLQNKTLGGAALDVLEEEATIKDEREILSEEYIELSAAKTLLLDHILLDMPNVVITPHNAFNSKEAILEIDQQTLLNIRSIAK